MISVVVVTLAILAGSLGEVPILLVAHGNGVSMVNGTHDRLIIPTTYGAKAVDFDYARQVIYAVLGSAKGFNDVVVRLPLSDLQTDGRNNTYYRWCELNDLCSQHLNKSIFWVAKEITKTYAATGPGSLVFDWTNNELFWAHKVNPYHSIIYYASANLSSNMLLPKNTMVWGQLTNLEIDPYERKLFFLQTDLENKTMVVSYSISSGVNTTVYKCNVNEQCNLRVDIHRKQLILMKNSTIGTHLLKMNYAGEQYNSTEYFGDSMFNNGTRIVNGRFFWIRNTKSNVSCSEGQHYQEVFKDVKDWRVFDQQAQTPAPNCSASCGRCCHYRDKSVTEVDCSSCQPEDVVIPETCPGSSSSKSSLWHAPPNITHERTPGAKYVGNEQVTEVQGVKNNSKSTTTGHIDNGNINKKEDKANSRADTSTDKLFTERVTVNASSALADSSNKSGLGFGSPLANISGVQAATGNANGMTLLYWLGATVWMSLTIVYFVIKRKVETTSYTAASIIDDDL